MHKISSSVDQEEGSYQLILQLEEPLEEFVQDDLTSNGNLKKNKIDKSIIYSLLKITPKFLQIFPKNFKIFSKFL